MRMKKRKKKPGDGRLRTGSASAAAGAYNSRRPLWRRAGRNCWVVMVTVTLCALPLAAKEKKVERTVSGQVLDQAENGIAGATVTLTDVNTGKKTAAFTRESGHYQFSDLQPTHDYEVQATFKGSSSDVRKASSIDSRHRIVLNLRIPPVKE